MILKLLLETRRVNVNSMDSTGHTPLSSAALNRFEGVVKLSQEHGAGDTVKGSGKRRWKRVKNHFARS